MSVIPDRVIAQVERAADHLLARCARADNPRLVENSAKLAAHGYSAVLRHRRRGQARGRGTR